jgi:heptosyltransferase-2
MPERQEDHPGSGMGDRGSAMRDRRVLVVSPNWLGDAIMALPAIADVKRQDPSAHLVVAARPAVASLFRLAPYVDAVVTLEWRGRTLRREGWDADLVSLRGAACRTAILLPNSFAAAWLTWRAGIAERWGYAADLRRPLLTRAIRKPSGSVHQAEYYQFLVRALGIRTGAREAVLDVPDAARRAARALLMDRGWDGGCPLIAMAPGAAYGTAKRWLPEHFARLAVMLSNERAAQCVLVGSGADGETTALVRALVRADASRPPIDLAGATSLDTLAGVLSLAEVCVSNDSGAMHLAAALGRPVVAIFGPTDERATRPLGDHEVIVEPVFCRPCMLRDCPIDHRCMKRITVDTVLAAVSRRLAAAPAV